VNNLVNWETAIAKFIVPDWGDKVNFTNVHTVQHEFYVTFPSNLCHLRPYSQSTKAGGPVRQPYGGVDYIPKSGIVNLASDDTDLRGRK
jgi:hypothetical protein